METVMKKIPEMNTITITDNPEYKTSYYPQVSMRSDRRKCVQVRKQMRIAPSGNIPTGYSG